MKKGLLVVVLATVALALLASAIGTAAAKGPSPGHLNWNAVWYPPTNAISQPDGSFIFEMQVKMDDPLGPGKVRYNSVITLNGGYSDALGMHVSRGTTTSTPPTGDWRGDARSGTITLTRMPPCLTGMPSLTSHTAPPGVPTTVGRRT